MRLADKGVEMDRALRSGRNWLAIAAAAFLAANLLHTADHLRQHMAGINTEILLAGGLLTFAAVGVLIFVLRRYPYAPLLAVIVGFEAALGVTASHIAPHWGVLSDSYTNDIHADALSWAVMLFEVAAGFVLGVVGVHYMRAARADDGAVRADALEWAKV
jgi:hypothetical protein